MPSSPSLSKGALKLVKDKLEKQTREAHLSMIILLIISHVPYRIKLINYDVI